MDFSFLSKKIPKIEKTNFKGKEVIKINNLEDVEASLESMETLYLCGSKENLNIIYEYTFKRVKELGLNLDIPRTFEDYSKSFRN